MVSSTSVRVMEWDSVSEKKIYYKIIFLYSPWNVEYEGNFKSSSPEGVKILTRKHSLSSYNTSMYFSGSREEMTCLGLKIRVWVINSLWKFHFQPSGKHHKDMQMSSDVFHTGHRHLEDTSVVEEMSWTQWHLKFTLTYAQQYLYNILCVGFLLYKSPDKILPRRDKHIFQILTR